MAAWALLPAEIGLVVLMVTGVRVPPVGQTTVAVELAGPVEFVRPLGGRGSAHTVRFHADDPTALVAELMRARTAPSPAPGRPG
jgi:hypothetical protein